MICMHALQIAQKPGQAQAGMYPLHAARGAMPSRGRVLPTHLQAGGQGEVGAGRAGSRL